MESEESKLPAVRSIVWLDAGGGVRFERVRRVSRPSQRTRIELGVIS